MATYSFKATSTSASGVTTLQQTGEFDTLEAAQAFMDNWVTSLNTAGYNGSSDWSAAFVNE